MVKKANKKQKIKKVLTKNSKKRIKNIMKNRKNKK